MKCILCHKPLSEEEEKEFVRRYDELSRKGIVPMLVPFCKECRESPTWPKRKSE